MKIVCVGIICCNLLVQLALSSKNSFVNAPTPIPKSKAMSVFTKFTACFKTNTLCYIIYYTPILVGLSVGRYYLFLALLQRTLKYYALSKKNS